MDFATVIVMNGSGRIMTGLCNSHTVSASELVQGLPAPDERLHIRLSARRRAQWVGQVRVAQQRMQRGDHAGRERRQVVATLEDEDDAAAAVPQGKLAQEAGDFAVALRRKLQAGQ